MYRHFKIRLNVTVVVAILQLSVFSASSNAQNLSEQLSAKPAGQLYAAAQRNGNSARGAILFHGALMGCGKCHSVSDSGPSLLGPNLSQPMKNLHPQHLVESILKPSAVIDDKFSATQVLTVDGNIITGLLVDKSEDSLVVRNADTLQDSAVSVEEVDTVKFSASSLMPSGLVRALSSEAEFLDLVKYVIEIQSGGAKRARELQPSAAQLAIKLPEYEARIDHSGMISDWNDDSFSRGEAIYQGLCVNCHGTLSAPGSLASALRFGEGKFKFGSDPHSMYQTLTRGSGLMLPQPWMVPQQKYDVIHYIREHFLRRNNPAHLTDTTDDYLAGLPTGDDRGPEPQPIEPWSQADYGPRLIGTFEIGSGGRNIAQKGIALQLDNNPGGVSQGEAWAIFDHDTMRVAGVWTSRGFIDWQGINFNGRHGIHPHIVGDILLANPTGPGWAHPQSSSLVDDVRVVGRDGKRYGPLPKDWTQYKGIYQVGKKSIISYSVGDAQVREAYDWFPSAVSVTNGSDAEDFVGAGLFARHVNIASRSEPLTMVLATLGENETWNVQDGLATLNAEDHPSSMPLRGFDGKHYLETESLEHLNLFDHDFTIRARIASKADGTIFSSAPAEGDWAPDGQTLFVRGGRLSYDIGWAGAIVSKERIDDGKPRDVAVSFDSKEGLTELWIDGERVGKKKLRPKSRLEDAVLRIGFTTPNFPGKSELSDATIDRVQCFSRKLSAEELENWDNNQQVVADWDFTSASEVSRSSQTLASLVNASDVVVRKSFEGQEVTPAWLGFESSTDGVQMQVRDNQLLLQIPSGDDAIQLTAWATKADGTSSSQVRKHVDVLLGKRRAPVLSIEPASAVYPEVVKTVASVGISSTGFAIDSLTIPKVNPWNARVRLTGIDFFEDPDRLAVCTWDGDVWLVSGLSSTTSDSEISWRRIAFGLFQPLGLKIIDETIFLTCRDQLVRLDDRNGDGEIDYYHCVNNDHQVTEHFHEFAMGLQTDEAGNFYYAKSARHALTAVVPHHGTLLRVSPDGSKTEIIANGFRAANGVCLNPDGTFIVTDQEGHWNPKNRINWVREGGFYGNMYGYHDVTDESDDAMEQPLCWITNAFDRSPAELLWCDSEAWGPLKGQLLNLSYGYGKVFVVPHEKIDGQVQGGMCAIPIPDFPTGIVRGRFSPHDKQLYLCGLAAWATNQTSEEGGLYRIRYTGEPAALPLKLHAVANGVEVGFSEPLGNRTSLEPSNYSVRVWSLKRTKNYGSEHYDEHRLKISKVTLSADRTRLKFELPELKTTWAMEIRMPVVTGDGISVERVIHNTIHNIPGRE